jgi:putative membrane protein
LVRWTAAFAYASKQTLRQERNERDFIPLLGKREAEWLVESQHMPMAIAAKIDALFREAIRSGGMDRFAYLQAQSERAQLIDHIGACERILKTPLAQVFSIKIRRFIFLYLISLPLAIVDKTHVMTPIIMLLVAYPLLSLDQIGIELQNPFCTASSAICRSMRFATISGKICLVCCPRWTTR